MEKTLSFWIWLINVNCVPLALTTASFSAPYIWGKIIRYPELGIVLIKVFIFMSFMFIAWKIRRRLLQQCKNSPSANSEPK